MAYRPSSVVLLGGGRGWLTQEAAASIQRIDYQIGHHLQITEAGRNWDQQNAHYQHYLRYGSPIALNPDTPSVHQIGNAIDSDEAQNDVAMMARNGWVRTVYRWVNGVWTLVERWHFEYFIEKDQHRNDPPPNSGQKNGDEMGVQVVRVDKKHQFTVAQEYIGHNGTAAQSQIAAAVFSTADEIHEISNDQFTSLLDALGIPQNVVKNGTILNPETGKWGANQVWSRSRENKALNAQITKKLDALAAKVNAL